MIYSNIIMTFVFKTLVFQLTFCTLSCSLFGASPQILEEIKILPEWKEHMELFQSIEPKLKKGDRTLYEKISPILNTAPEQAIYEIQSTAVDRRSPIFDFLLGNLLLAEGQSELAEQALKTCLVKFPNFKKAHRSLGSLYVQRESFEQARRHLAKVIELGGISHQIYGLLAYTHFQEENYLSALGAYRMARVLDADHLSYKKGELYCLAQLQKNEEVIQLCQELLNIDPDKKDYWMLQVNALLRLDRPLEALALLEIVQRKGLAKREEFELLGRLYFNERLYDHAVEVFGLAMATGSPMSRFITPMNVLISQSRVGEAQALLASAKKHMTPTSFTGDEEWHMAEVQLLLMTGADDEAEEECRRLLKRWPMSESGLMTLAQHLAKKGDVDEARFLYERAALLESVQVKAWRELGRLAWLDRDALSAIRWLEKVDEVEPSMEMKETIDRLRERL
jgi:tetratricopeptide (TPR) repeat protein